MTVHHMSYQEPPPQGIDEFLCEHNIPWLFKAVTGMLHKILRNSDELSQHYNGGTVYISGTRHEVGRRRSIDKICVRVERFDKYRAPTGSCS